MADVIVYSTNYCPFCKSAKELLKKLNIPFDEFFLDNDQKTWDRLSQENNGWRTVPMIFVKEKFVGGYQDLYDLHIKGNFLPLLTK